ncbi:MAG: TIR domain-containing protein [Kofleriaceae bacterium]
MSYVFEDKAYFDQVEDWQRGGLLGPDVVVIGESKDVRQGGDPAIRAHLTDLIRGAAAMLVLVGNDTHNHGWVRYEMSFATQRNQLILATQIPGTHGPAPEGFRHLPLLPFDPTAIRAALEGR